MLISALGFRHLHAILWAFSSGCLQVTLMTEQFLAVEQKSLEFDCQMAKYL